MRDYGQENPQRDLLVDDLSQLFSRGYTLLARDIEAISLYYGYTRNTARAWLLEKPQFRQQLASNGVALVIEKYRGHRIFKDGSLDPEETDIEDNRRVVDGFIDYYQLRGEKPENPWANSL